MPRTHVPVLAGELIEALDPQPGQVAVDCTLGAAGHARLVADRIGPAGTLIAIDRDPLAEEAFAELAAEVPCQTRFLRADFEHGLRILAEEGVQADLAYLDLGMSSMQVDTRERGFSYAYDAPLDMRMDPEQELTRARSSTRGSAAGSPRLREYGEERYADRIAAADRPPPAARDAPFELVDAITAAIPAPARFAGGHPAKRTFQAIRIAVNEELAQLDAALPLAWQVLKPGGRLAGDLLPLARGPPRQALHRRPPAGLHLPARPAGLRLRAHARGRARVPPLGRAHRGRGRGQPPLEVRAAAGRPQAQGGALMAAHRRAGPPARPRARAAPRHPRRVCGPIARPLPAVALPRAAAPRDRPASSSACARCPSTGCSTACCAAARGSG